MHRLRTTLLTPRPQFGGLAPDPHGLAAHVVGRGCWTPVKEIIHHKHGAQVLEVPRAAQRDQSRWQENPRRHDLGEGERWQESELRTGS